MKCFLLKSFIKKMQNKVFISINPHFFSHFLSNWFHIKTFLSIIFFFENSIFFFTKIRKWSDRWLVIVHFQWYFKYLKDTCLPLESFLQGRSAHWEKRRHSVWKSPKKSHSTLRAKRASFKVFHFFQLFSLFEKLFWTLKLFLLNKLLNRN